MKRLIVGLMVVGTFLVGAGAPALADDGDSQVTVIVHMSPAGVVHGCC